MEFKESLSQNADRVEKILEKILTKLPKNNVNEAIAYSLRSSGKRLRPFIVFETAKMFSGIDENVERIAAAIEMIHTYSLIHDDLPCMDNDDMRRGQPSCHKKFGETAAVLAGDGLLNLAAETLLDGKYSENYFRAIKFIFECSGIFGMVGGQTVDLCKNKSFDEDTLDFLTENKTSKLIMACVGAVCIYMRSTEIELEDMLSFASNFGKAFQAADDLLDSGEDDNLNYVVFYGAAEAKNKAEQLTACALESLSHFSNTSENLISLCKYNLVRKS